MITRWLTEDLQSWYGALIFIHSSERLHFEAVHFSEEYSFMFYIWINQKKVLFIRIHTHIGPVDVVTCDIESYGYYYLHLYNNKNTMLSTETIYYFVQS